MRVTNIEKMRIAERKFNDEQAKIKQDKMVKLHAIMKHDREDEHAVFVHLKNFARDYAIHTATYLPLLERFKGPNMTADAFREQLYRVFNVKLTFSEVGLLANRCNAVLAKKCVVDGTAFLKSFLKLGRLQEQVLLGHLDDSSITMHSIFPGAISSEGGVGGGHSGTQTSTSPARSALSPIRRSKPSMPPETKSDTIIAPESPVAAVSQSGMVFDVLGGNPWVDWGIKEAGFLGTPIKKPAPESGKARALSAGPRSLTPVDEGASSRSP